MDKWVFDYLFHGDNNHNKEDTASYVEIHLMTAMVMMMVTIQLPDEECLNYLILETKSLVQVVEKNVVKLWPALVLKNLMMVLPSMTHLEVDSLFLISALILQDKLQMMIYKPMDKCQLKSK